MNAYIHYIIALATSSYVADRWAGACMQLVNGSSHLSYDT